MSPREDAAPAADAATTEPPDHHDREHAATLDPDSPGAAIGADDEGGSPSEIPEPNEPG